MKPEPSSSNPTDAPAAASVLVRISEAFAGIADEVLKQFGVTSHAGVMLRFAGAYQRDDNGAVDAEV